MSAEWFYTTNKQQMGPVSWNELQELATGGILKAHDMVWTEGMDEWVKAVNQKGLFTDEAAEEAPVGKRKSYAEPKPPPGRRGRERDDDEDDEEDPKEKKRSERKRQEDRAKMAVGLKIGLGLAAGFFLLLLLGCAGIVLIWLTVGFGGGGGGPVHETYTVRNLQQQAHAGDDRGQNVRQYTFRQGRTVTISVVNNLANPNTDVDLYVYRGNALNALAWDVRVPFQDRNCRVEFVVPATDTYRVRVVNLGPGQANSCVVTVDER